MCHLLPNKMGSIKKIKAEASVAASLLIEDANVPWRGTSALGKGLHSFNVSQRRNEALLRAY